ncbi:GGDEF domain-containing protein [Actinoplanes sp. NBRC 103695]|uniref:GGDEF domain-containing protein n=1 Tax=Actinoplanes sp. NBRC 103695 TaxID=3032202 RepID=UPI0024A11F53|nr:GGDEF domain-containing protein [Actinoplanes sp. NBRC 103695]GLY93110.1 hypothetical protein Acsp02_03660 [Actinoplanes sp. NBRC 103695]
MRRVPAPLLPVFAALCGLPTAIWPGTVFAHVCYQVGFVALVVLGWARLRSLHGLVRTGYAFIVGALTVWLLGDLLYDVLDRLIGPLGLVSPSDVFWISGYPLLAIGLGKLVRLRAPGKLREGLLDALAMATVMAWLCWQFIILPAFEGERFTLGTLGAALYPLGDVVLFAAAAILILAPGPKRGPTLYLAAALVVTLIGDVAISMLPQIFPDLPWATQVDRLDGALLVANSFFAAALVHRDAARIAEPDDLLEQRLHPARVVFLGIALVALPMFAGMQTFDSLVSRISLLTSIAVLTSLILVRFVLVVREQEYIRAVLAHRAQHDQLTGLANRQALLSRLDLALLRSRSRAKEFGPVVYYLDLNGFKQINDRHGHASGDYVLVEFARRLRSDLRPGDIAARLGGDEFVVLAQNVDNEDDAQAIAERLRGLCDEPVWRSDECFTIGVSIGVAAASSLPEPDAEALLAAADGEMYAEKTSRRDRRTGVTGVTGRHREPAVAADAITS